MNAISMEDSNKLIEARHAVQKTREQILSQEVLTNKDIQMLLHIKKTKASEVMNAIRSVSNILNVRTIIHIKDYNAYTSRFDKKILAQRRQLDEMLNQL